MTVPAPRDPPVDQRGWAERGGLVNQAGRDAYYVDQRGAGRVVLAPLRPAVERAELEPTVRGRDGLLTALCGMLMGDVTGPRVQVLHGMGGCGKTTVARELTRTALGAGIPAWWIAATSVESVASGMQALAVALGADPQRLRVGSLPEIVWARLAAQAGPWLLVFDNADDPLRVLCPAGGVVTGGDGWLRPVAGTGMVVVTSRDGSHDTWGGGRRRWLETRLVPPLDAMEGGAVLGELAGAGAGSPADAQALSGRIGGLPLALRIVGSYLAETARIPARLADRGTIRTFADYREALDQGEAHELFAVGGTTHSDDQMRELIGGTWELSLDLLAARGMPSARPLLRLLACFAAAPIPYDVLLRVEILAEHPQFAGITGNRVWRLLQALAGLGLIDLEAPSGSQTDRSHGHTAVLHPLVRDASAADRAPIEDPAELTALAARLVALAIESGDIGPPEDPQSWPCRQALLPHAAHLLGQVLQAADRLPRHTVESVCRARRLTGQYLHARGFFESAEVEYRTVFDASRRVLGEEHLTTVLLRHSITRLLQDRGELAEAEAEARLVLAAVRRILGDEHPQTLDIRRNLAGMLHDRGDLRAAEPELQAVLAIQRRVLGEEHYDTQVTRHVHAVLLHDLGRLASAESEFRAVVATARRVHGEGSPHTLLARRNFAALLRDRGQLMTADAELQAVLAICREVLGEEHRDTLGTRSSLAEVRRDRGEWDVAEPEFRAVLAIQRRVLGHEHRDTLSTRRNLAMVLHHRGERDAAEAEFRAVLAVQRRLLGEDHPQTRSTRVQLGRLLHDPNPLQPEI